MKLERTKNANRSIFFGIILKIYQIIMPFVMRTAMIYLMGVQYLGLNSLFSSILQVLNLAELGVGSAMVFSMYQPIAKEDSETICALEKLYRSYYNIIGLIIAIVGCILTPFIPILIKGEIPSDLNIYLLYLLNLVATVLSYWFYAYKNSLFLAHQRNDIISKISLITSTIQYALQLFVLGLFHNYYLFIIVMLATQLINNILISILADLIYPKYKPKGKLSNVKRKEINKRVRDVFTAKLGATIVNSADTIIISAFLGLTVLAMYQNYYFIMTSIMGIITIFLYSVLAGVGNSLVTEHIDKNYNDFKKLVFMINWITTTCICFFAVVYQPFIELWVGKEYMFDYGVVILLCIYFYLVILQQVIGTYKDAAGIWHQDRFRPLLSALVNLILNLSFVKIWGIYAIILSTILSYLMIGMPWMIINVFKYVFKRSCKEFVVLLIRNIIVCTCVAITCYFVTMFIKIENDIFAIGIDILICLVLSQTILLFLYKNDIYFNYMLDYLNEFTGFKFKKVIYRLKKVKIDNSIYIEEK